MPISFVKILLLSYNLVSMVYFPTNTILFVLIFIVCYSIERNQSLNDLFEGEKRSLNIENFAKSNYQKR